MMKKNIIVIILIIILLTVLSGCWSKKEPRDLAIITSIVYDLDEEEGYRVIIELLDATGDSSQSGQDTVNKSGIIIVNKGKSIPEALRKDLSQSRLPYGGNNKIRIFTSRLAEKGIIDIMDFFTRDQLADERPIMMVLKDEDPLKFYDAESFYSQLFSTHIEDLKSNRTDTAGNAVFPTTIEFIRDYYSEGKQPVMGSIELMEHEGKLPDEEQGNGNGDASSDHVVTYGLSAFKGDKLVGYLNAKETEAYNFITNNIKKIYISFPLVEGNCTVKVIKTKTKITTEMKGDVINVNIDIKSRLSLTDEESQIDTLDIKNLPIIQDAYNKTIKEMLINAVEKVQEEFKSDIFGFGSIYHCEHPKEWKEIKKTWDDEYFPNLKVNVNVESKLTNSGETRQPFGSRES